MFRFPTLVFAAMAFLAPGSVDAATTTGLIKSSKTGNCWLMGDYPYHTMDYDTSKILSVPCDGNDPKMFFEYDDQVHTFKNVNSGDCVDAYYHAGDDYHVKMWECHGNEPQQRWTLDPTLGLKTQQGFCMRTDDSGGIIKSVPCDDARREVFKFYEKPASEIPAKTTLSPTPAPGQPTMPPTLRPASHGTGGGDPHFKTWNGDKFDFHGACDLVLFHSPNFANGLGLTVHIRTKIETWWSFIEAAVIKIGDQTFELRGNPEGEGPRYWVNGLPGNREDVENDEMLTSLENVVIKVHYKRVSDKQHKFRFDLNNKGDAISLATYNDWVSVHAKAADADNFAGTQGLMGAFPDGAKIARDGKTVMVDTDAFGKEWQVQVNNNEPALFHSLEGVQYPEACIMPDLVSAAATKKRRLGQSMITRDDAIEACARVHEDDKDACIYDVLAINDKDAAGAY